MVIGQTQPSEREIVEIDLEREAINSISGLAKKVEQKTGHDFCSKRVVLDIEGRRELLLGISSQMFQTYRRTNDGIDNVAYAFVEGLLFSRRLNLFSSKYLDSDPLLRGVGYAGLQRINRQLAEAGL